MPSYAETVQARLGETGIKVELVSSTEEPAAFGNALAIFRAGPFFLRFIRDRGQQFLDLAAEVRPDKFHQFGDVEVALGWRTLEDLPASRAPPSIDDYLERLKTNFPALIAAFAQDQEGITAAQVEQIARDRGQAILVRFQGRS